MGLIFRLILAALGASSKAGFLPEKQGPMNPLQKPPGSGRPVCRMLLVMVRGFAA